MDPVALSAAALQAAVALALIFVVPGLALGPLLAPGASTPLGRIGRAVGASLLTTSIGCTVLAWLGILRPASTIAPAPGRQRSRPARSGDASIRDFRRAVADAAIRWWLGAGCGGRPRRGRWSSIPSRLAVGESLLPFTSTVWYYANLAAGRRRRRPLPGGPPGVGHRAAVPDRLPAGHRPHRRDAPAPARRPARPARALPAGPARRRAGPGHASCSGAGSAAGSPCSGRSSSWPPSGSSSSTSPTSPRRSRSTWPCSGCGWSTGRSSSGSRRLAPTAAVDRRARLPGPCRGLPRLPGGGRRDRGGALFVVAGGPAALARASGSLPGSGDGSGSRSGSWPSAVVGGTLANGALTGSFRIVGYVTADRPETDRRSRRPRASSRRRSRRAGRFSGDPTWDFYVAAVAPAEVGQPAPHRFLDPRMLPRSILVVWSGLDARQRAALVVLLALLVAADRRLAVPRSAATPGGPSPGPSSASRSSPARTSCSRSATPTSRSGPGRAGSCPTSCSWPSGRASSCSGRSTGWPPVAGGPCCPHRGAMVAAGTALAILCTGDGLGRARWPRSTTPSRGSRRSATTPTAGSTRTSAPDARILTNAYTDGALTALSHRVGIVDGRAVYLENPRVPPRIDRPRPRRPGRLRGSERDRRPVVPRSRAGRLPAGRRADRERQRHRRLPPVRDGSGRARRAAPDTLWSGRSAMAGCPSTASSRAARRPVGARSRRRPAVPSHAARSEPAVTVAGASEARPGPAGPLPRDLGRADGLGRPDGGSAPRSRSGSSPPGCSSGSPATSRRWTRPGPWPALGLTLLSPVSGLVVLVAIAPWDEPLTLGHALGLRNLLPLALAASVGVRILFRPRSMPWSLPTLLALGPARDHAPARRRVDVLLERADGRLGQRHVLAGRVRRGDDRDPRRDLARVREASDGRSGRRSSRRPWPVCSAWPHTSRRTTSTS